MARHEVSRETAKIVLKNLVNDGLAISIPGKGTYVASNRKIKKEWGLVIPFFSSNLEELLNHLSYEAGKYGRKLNFYLDYNTPLEEMRLVGTMIKEGFEAIIIVPNFDESLTAEFYRKLNNRDTRIVLIDNTMAGSYFNYVIQSYDLGVKRAFDYLKEKNRKNILFIRNETWRGKNLVHDLMEQTLKSLIERDKYFRELFVISRIKDLHKEMINTNDIGGVLASTDIESIRLAGRLKKWKINVPGEVSIVSYGNTELTEFFKPSITSIDCHYKEMAELTSSLIINQDLKSVREQHVIQPELIIRET
jgi:DNA-binding LacI/PurR family transcriptional regulator